MTTAMVSLVSLLRLPRAFVVCYHKSRKKCVLCLGLLGLPISPQGGLLNYKVGYSKDKYGHVSYELLLWL